MRRPTLGIFGLTGCAGDQLALLDCEQELLRILELVDVRDFLMAATGGDTTGPLDVALVEGVVASRRDEQALRAVRSRARLVGALGTCAVWGGVPTMDRGIDRAATVLEIYGEAGAGYDTLPARALHEVVPIDFAIVGCPVEKGELLAALAGLARGDLPLPATLPVCAECRMREAGCLFERAGSVCCGPVTAAGCDARCPALAVPCTGCRGPSRDAHRSAWADLLATLGVSRAEAQAKAALFAPVTLDPPEEMR